MIFEDGALGDDGFQKMPHFIDEVGKIERLLDGLSLPRIGQQLIGELSGALTRGFDLLDVRPDG